MSRQVIAATQGEAHHFIGFHDVDPWSPDGRILLHMRVERIVSPPDGEQLAAVAVRHLDSGDTRVLAHTLAWNFPQGARQQWALINGRQQVVMNNWTGKGWGACLIDPATGVSRQLSRAIYALDGTRSRAFCMSFDRAHRLGGYGYVRPPGSDAGSLGATDAGIWQLDLATGAEHEVCTLAEVTAATGRMPAGDERTQYLTHLLPSPDGKSLAFLHRYWLPDGGIHTRLMVLSLSGQGVECWAEGFLTHFDWVNSQEIMIWGRPFSGMQAMRGGRFTRVPGMRTLLSPIKRMLRPLLHRSGALHDCYLIINADGVCGAMSPEVLTHDGHPSFRPGDRALLLADTYPDEKGERELFLFDKAVGRKTELGRYQQMRAAPETSGLDKARRGMDPTVQRFFSDEQFAYSRSGIHCDLHPRWRTDGKIIAFDSNHEGSRQVYSIEV